ncbi:MAG: hypothetical protein IT458_13365 [Planctomycetes bacterium]|nr:hypothetical protein [Planctomycetota bacterium]
MKKGNPALWFAILVGAGVAAAVGIAAFLSEQPPAGPVTPVFDKQACVFCKMHVGEPRFAAQLQTRGGDVHFYDDPGCLAEHLAAERLDVHAIYFRHLHEDRWVILDKAGFVPITPTPMGFGYGAVDAGAPGAIPFEAFEAKALARTRKGNQ